MIVVCVSSLDVCYRPHPTSAREVTGEPPGHLDWMAKIFSSNSSSRCNNIECSWKILARARVGTKDMAVCYFPFLFEIVSSTIQVIANKRKTFANLLGASPTQTSFLRCYSQ